MGPAVARQGRPCQPLQRSQQQYGGHGQDGSLPLNCLSEELSHILGNTSNFFSLALSWLVHVPGKSAQTGPMCGYFFSPCAKHQPTLPGPTFRVIIAGLGYMLQSHRV